MNLEQCSPEELRELSMIEVAYSILETKKQATSFQEMVQEIAATIGLSQEEVTRRLSQFYTDLNIDGRFINVGENRLWGLRSWYPYEQIEEEILPQPKPKKKRKTEDDLEDFVAEDDFDDIDELEEDIDDLDELEEDDLDEEVDEDLDEEIDEDDDDDVDEFDDELIDEDEKLEELDEDEDFVDEDEAEYDEVEEEKEL